MRARRVGLRRDSERLGEAPQQVLVPPRGPRATVEDGGHLRCARRARPWARASARPSRTFTCRARQPPRTRRHRDLSEPERGPQAGSGGSRSVGVVQTKTGMSPTESGLAKPQDGPHLGCKWPDSLEGSTKVGVLPADTREIQTPRRPCVRRRAGSSSTVTHGFVQKCPRSRIRTSARRRTRTQLSPSRNDPTSYEPRLNAKTSGIAWLPRSLAPATELPRPLPPPLVGLAPATELSRPLPARSPRW